MSSIATKKNHLRKKSFAPVSILDLILQSQEVVLGTVEEQLTRTVGKRLVELGFLNQLDCLKLEDVISGA